jgi:hypothetical protein
MSSLRQPGRILRFTITIAFTLMASSTAVLTMPRTVVACSCLAFETLKQAVTPESAVFTGTAGLRQARGVPVEIERWFVGPRAAPVVWLSGQSFGDGASCGIAEPPPGSSWLWVARPVEDGTLGTGLCSPSGRLDTPEGQAMLAEAIAAYGAVPPVAPPEVTQAPEAFSNPTPVANPTPAATPAAEARDRTAVTILGALLLGSLALFGGLVLLARGSSRGAGRTPPAP